jgi:hypothetical protein
MKLLFALSSPEYLRFYDTTIVELARRGHDVSIAVNTIREGKPVRLDAIGAEHPRVSVAGVIPPRGDGWETLARAVRGTQDFVRYLHPDLAGASRLRERVKWQALPWALATLDRIASLSPGTVAWLMRRLAAVERGIPVSEALVGFVDRHAPDLLLVSPLVEPASDQVDLVRAAQARGIRVATLVASWDNLTNKGDLRVATGMIAVWNETQKREAIELHRVAPEQLIVTGAQAFDRWFDRSVTRPRDVFCREIGLPGTKPFVLYTGSSIFIARAEVEVPFVRRWIEALRESADPAVRDLGVLVRPHPYNGRAWPPDALSDLPGVAVWPRGGFDPVDESQRAGYFDSLFHCAAVVGINTSAMVEATIVGRPVLSIETPEFAGTQEGTLHYRYLRRENGGFLRVASDFDEHLRQLSGLLGDPETARAELTRFVGHFIRPHGVARPATSILVEAIERYAASPRPAPLRASRVRTALLAWPLGLLAPLAPSGSARRRTQSERKRRAVRKDAAVAGGKP